MARDLDAGGAFLSAYSSYISKVLIPTQDEVRETLQRWRDPQFWGQYTKTSRLPAPSPIHRFRTRIKRPESVVDKILRKPDTFPNGLHPASFTMMKDALGARIVVYFPTNLLLIDHEIRNSPTFEISHTDPPVAYVSAGAPHLEGLNKMTLREKPSGYASLHYSLRVRSSVISADERPWFEMQVRTMIEDVWSEIEHVLGYKPAKRTSFAVTRQFRSLSRMLLAIDEQFDLLNDELARYQGEVTYPDDHPLNAENLPPVLNDFGVGCAQREIDGMLKVLASRGVTKVGELRVGLANRLEQIKNTYLVEEGREPGNFEIVASFAATSHLRDEEGVADAVKAQIAFLNAWESTKPKKEQSSGPRT